MHSPTAALVITLLAAFLLQPAMGAPPAPARITARRPEHTVVKRAQPASRRLIPTARIEVPENRDDRTHFDKFPIVELPPDLWAVNTHFQMQARDLLQVLDRGYSHISAFQLFREGSGQDHPGYAVPYTRRWTMIYNNAMDAHNPASKAWREGRVPRDDAERAEVRRAFMDYADDGGWFKDGKASQLCCLDIEAGPAEGEDLNRWEEVKRDAFFDPINAERGKRYPTNIVLFSTSSGEHDSWIRQQNAAERMAYLKFNFWSATQNSHTWNGDVNNQGARFAYIATHYGNWVDFVVRNTEAAVQRTRELGLTRRDQPPMNMYTTGYDCLVCNGDDLTTNAAAYFLRPDIAEGLPIWSYMSGAKGTILWQTVVNSPRWRTEEAFLQGLWRISQHADVFTGNQTYLIPEVCADDRTWYTPDNGYEQGRWGNSLTDHTRLGEFFNDHCRWPDVVPHRDKRIQVRAVVNGRRLLVAAIDAWQEDPKARRKIRIRIPELRFSDTITLYGRETYLGGATLPRSKDRVTMYRAAP